jgi:solute:Na+ symporter, SSS family
MIALAMGDNIIPAKLTAAGVPLLDTNGNVVLDYDLATPMMLVKLFPTGMLGLGLTALIASFMSGMAGNVTAFNTVWTYDIYQAHIKKHASDEHYLWMGRVATVGGIALSVAAAYVAGAFNNIMEFLQLVFAFVNAPLFATFALGMFWKRSTGHGAFWGLFAGTVAPAIHHGISLANGAEVGVKGFFGVVLNYPSEMAQTFWTAIAAFTTCFVVTIVVSLATSARKESELEGLVYSLTPRPKDDARVWYEKPSVFAMAVLVAMVGLNVAFF